MPPSFILSTAFSNSAPVVLKNGISKGSNTNNGSTLPDVSDFKTPLDCTTPFGCETPFEFEEADVDDDDDDDEDKSSPGAKLKYAAYFEQQRFLQK